MSDKQKRLTSAKSFIHGKKTRARTKRSPSDETNDAVPIASSCKDLLQSQDTNTIEVNWESPKISQGRQSKVKSTADLLPSLSPTDSNEVTPPSCSPLIQIRYRSPLNSQLMSTPLRHQGSREKYTQRRMNSRSYTDDALQHVISAISSCHNEDLTNQTRAASGVTDPVRIDLVINESTEIRNGITVGHVAAVLSSSLESRSQRFSQDNSLSTTANHITKKDVVAVLAQLNSSTAESDIWTDDEFFLSEAVLEATQATTNICPTIPRSSCSVSPQYVKRKSKLANTPELGVKKSGRYTFALEDGTTSRTSIRPLQPSDSLYKPLFPPPQTNRCLVDKAGFLENNEDLGDTSLTDELLATIVDPDFFQDTQVDNRLPVDTGCHTVVNGSEVVGPTKLRHDESGCTVTGVKDEADVSEMFGDISDDGLTEQELMALLDTVESQVPRSAEPVAGSLSVTVAKTNSSPTFPKGSSTSVIARTRQNSVTAEKTTNFGRDVSLNSSSTMLRNTHSIPFSDSKNAQNKNKVSAVCPKVNASKCCPTKLDSFQSKIGAVEPVKAGNVSTDSSNVRSSVQSFVRSSETKERSLASVTRLNVKSLSSDSIMVPCEAGHNRFGTSSQNQTMCGQNQRCSAAEVERKKQEAMRRRELKLKGKP